MNTKKIKIAILTDTLSEHLGLVFSDFPLFLANHNDSFTAVETIGSWNEDPVLGKAFAEKKGYRNLTLDEIRDEADLVLNYMCGPTKDDLSREMVSAGKHVLVLKRCADSLKNAKEIAAIAEEKGVVYASSMDDYLSASMQTARYLLDHGIIGKPGSGVMSMNRRHFVLGESTTFLYEPAHDVFNNMSNWYLFPMITMLGPVRRVFAFGTASPDSYLVKKTDSEFYGQEYSLHAHDVITAVLEFVSGVKFTLHMNGNSSPRQRYIFDIYGDEGVLILSHPHDYDSPVLVQKNNADPVSVPFTHGFDHHIQELAPAEVAWSLFNHRKSRINAEISVHEVDIMEGIKESIRTGLPVEMTTTCERPEPLQEGYIGNGFWQRGEETVLSL